MHFPAMRKLVSRHQPVVLQPDGHSHPFISSQLGLCGLSVNRLVMGDAVSLFLAFILIDFNKFNVNLSLLATQW